MYPGCARRNPNKSITNYFICFDLYMICFDFSPLAGANVAGACILAALGKIQTNLSQIIIFVLICKWFVLILARLRAQVSREHVSSLRSEKSKQIYHKLFDLYMICFDFSPFAGANVAGTCILAALGKIQTNLSQIRTNLLNQSAVFYLLLSIIVYLR